MSFRAVIGIIILILGCFSMVIIGSESQSTLNHLEPIDRIKTNDCKFRMDFYPFKKCCALEQCKSIMYICKENPDENDTASSGCMTVEAEKIPLCPDDVNDKNNEFLPIDGTYQWLATTSSQLCCWDVLMPNKILREFTIKETESTKWTVRYFEFGVDLICRSTGKNLPDPPRTNVKELEKDGRNVTNPDNNLEACYPYDEISYETFDYPDCGFSNDK